MNKQLTLGQYRAIDLGILLLVQVFCQLLIHFATQLWFPEQLYVASPLGGIVALVMMRWGGWSALHACLGGLLYAWLSGGQWQHLLIFGLGNLAALGALPLRNALCKGKGIPRILYGVAVQLLCQLGRGLTALALGFSADACLGFLTTDSLSILLTLLIIWIVGKMDGLFEDQIHYLRRLEQAREAERRDQV